MTVLITAPYHDEGLKELTELFGRTVHRPWKKHGRDYREDELIRMIQETNASGLITELDEVSERVIDILPDSAFIGNVISFLRHTYSSHQWLKDGKWNGDYLQAYVKFRGNELTGKTVGLIGFGAVGQRIARLLAAFDCKVLYYDPFVRHENREYEKTTIERVFSESDIVSVHLPRTEETIGLIGARHFQLMKQEAVFVNTSRAAVTDREELLRVLKERRIKGAILDVFYHEPPESSDYELISLPNVLATPHLAGATFEVEDHHVKILNEALFKWKQDQTCSIRELYNKRELEPEGGGCNG
ncbi:NAD(P)-dependent oxidoreductase [Bacillus sp. SIMBA_026]|uniref:NAD(P)-dependent oxidoreductase n=1 Tax=Bacillus sp. SIMBA_026 TaxID=3085769 RepID=UPI003979B514